MAKKKLTVRQLQQVIRARDERIEQLEDGQRNLIMQRDEARTKVADAEQQVGMARRDVMNVEQDSRGQLFEIIRWLANKESAFDPFNRIARMKAEEDRQAKGLPPIYPEGRRY